MNQPEEPRPAIIFDFGGVLLDWNPRYLYRRFFENDTDAMERFLTEIGFVDWNAHQDRGRPFAVAVAELSARFPQYAELIKAYDERWEESLGGPIPETVEILQTLKQAGYPLYGLSNWSAETFGRVRHRYAFLDCFETIVLSGEVKMMKPDPRIYTLLLERIGHAAGECLFIDDSKANIETAEDLGFRTILFESPGQLRQGLGNLGIL